MFIIFIKTFVFIDKLENILEVYESDQYDVYVIF